MAGCGCVGRFWISGKDLDGGVNVFLWVVMDGWILKGVWTASVRQLETTGGCSTDIVIFFLFWKNSDKWNIRFILEM